MNKADFINFIAKENDIYKYQAEQVVEMFLDALRKNIIAGEEIVFRNLFSMYLKVKKSYKTINPVTREEMVVPQTIYPYCNFMKSFKDEIKSIEYEIKQTD